MKGTKKSRPGGSDTRTATEQGQASRQGHASNDDFNTSRSGGQTGIASLLMHGAENGLRLRELVQLTGTDSRTIRRQVELERRQGIAICTNNKSGYYLAADEQERQLFVSSMRHRAAEIEKTAAAVEGADIDWT